MRKGILFFTITVLLVFGAYLGYKLVIKKSIHIDAVAIIPPDAIFILEAEHPIENWKSFSSSDFWSFLKTHPYLKELNQDALYLDSIISENKTLLKHFGNRSFHMSAHMTHENDYDFLFLIDLKKASSFNPSLIVLQTMFDSEFFKVTKQKYQSNEIFNISDLTEGDHLYMTKVANFMLFSYSLPLIKTGIDNKSEHSLTANKNYLEVANEVASNGLIRLYIQYNFIDEYLNVYTNGNEGIVKSLSSSFAFTGLNLELSDNLALMEGFTSIPDTIKQYSSLIHQYGNTSLEFQNVTSSRAAYAQVVGLNDFKSFYKNLLALKQNDPATVQNYIEVKTKVEKALNLSLEEDFLSWIGNEAVIARFEPNKFNKFEDDYVLAIKANDIANATEKLLKVQKQIKKRTPAKFQKMAYKTHAIYYLDIKGFFGLFFGKAFDKITKPYYTIIEDYLIFSNNPTSLIATLEDYENGNVLASLPSFIKLKENLPKKIALFTYVNGELAYNSLTKSINDKELSQYKSNKKYFNFFKSIGIAYVSKNEGFSNVIAAHYGEKNNITLGPPPLIDSLENAYFEDYASTLQNLSEAETFVLYNINNGAFTKYFKATNIVQIKAQTKKGVFHGKYTEYFKNGKIRAKGKYRKGRKVGRWEYYDFNGVLSEKEWEGF